jgi:F-type H+-transporting ATPase subunit epsilon
VRLSVTTPRGSLVDTEVDELSAPGVLGEFGVLPGHVPFLSALKPGVFVYRQKSDSHVLAVSDGILEVVRADGGDKVLVLVSDAKGAEEIDRADATQQVAAADAELAKWSKDLGGEYKALLNRRAWAAARADAAGRVTPH